MKRKEIISKNYLEMVPLRPSHIEWIANEKGIVTLFIENKGIVKRTTQIFFNKPRVSNIHLDEMGSFIWQTMDGEMDIAAIGHEVKNKFGDIAEPLYERLAKFFKVLESYEFVILRE